MPKYPKALTEKLNDFVPTPDRVGMSFAEVIRWEKPGEALYLKTAPASARDCLSIGREHRALAWAKGRLRVPEIEYFGADGENEYLLTWALPGQVLESFIDDPGFLIGAHIAALRALWQVDIADCPFDARAEKRLSDLRYLLDHGLTDDPENWEEDNEFDDPEEIYNWLAAHIPAQDDLALSHGDFTTDNIFLSEEQPGFIDLGRLGVASRWNDIALCVRTLQDLPDSDRHIASFFDRLCIEPDWAQIKYFILLDELF